MSSDPRARLDALIAREALAGQQQAAALLEPPVVDLKTLLGELTALKQEVRAETQATRQLRDEILASHKAPAPPQAAPAAPSPAALGAAAREAAEAREQGRRERARLLIELIDRLELSCQSARALAAPRWHIFGRRVDKGALALAEGLELTLRHMRERLADLDVERIEIAPGAPFDPRAMEALEVVDRAGLPGGSVVEVARPGYRDSARVLRLAQVIVTRGAAAAALPSALDKESHEA